MTTLTYENPEGDLDIATLACRADQYQTGEMEQSEALFLTSSFCFESAAQAAAEQARQMAAQAGDQKVPTAAEQAAAEALQQHAAAVSSTAQAVKTE